jgi:hypothetical protein
MRHAGFLAILAASVMCFHVLALAAGKLPAADAYNERLKTIANQVQFQQRFAYLFLVRRLHRSCAQHLSYSAE